MLIFKYLKFKYIYIYYLFIYNNIFIDLRNINRINISNI